MNTELPYFSIIVLAWHVEKYIAECLESVKGQTYQNFEVIIVAPPGNDRTYDICTEFVRRDSRFTVLDVENRGQLLNRIAGFSKARGEYLLCMDGDDLWKPELLESVWKGIKAFHADLVIFGKEKFGEDQPTCMVSDTFPYNAVYEGNEKRVVFEKYIQSGPINEIWIKAFRRSVFESVDEDFSAFEKIRKSEDLLYSCFVTTAADSILYLALPLYRYRLHESSITHTFHEDEIRDYYGVKEIVRKFMALWHMEDEAYCICFYRAIASYTTDWIYRCAVSDLPFAKKRALYRWLREDAPFYAQSSVLWSEISMKAQHRMFVRLYKTNDVLLEVYARIFKFGKRVKQCLKGK